MAAEKRNDVMAMRLKLLRIQNSLTQAQVAKELNITQQTYSKYENVGAGLDGEVITLLCKKYGVTADYLLGLSEDDGRNANRNSNQRNAMNIGNRMQVAYQPQMGYPMGMYGYEEPVAEKEESSGKMDDIKTLLEQMLSVMSSDKKQS